MTIGNKRVKSRKDDFVKLVTNNKEKRWYVCSHDNPDPDSLASAFCISHILRFLGIEDIKIVYCGEIAHPQNRAFVNVLQLNITKWEENNPDGMFIFVDCSINQKNMSIKRNPNIVIDHHKINATNRDILFIHDEVGACSTLAFDLALNVTRTEERSDSEPVDLQAFDPDEDGAKELATALSVGIKTDTLDFRSETTTNDDFLAFQILSRYTNDDKFNRIINYELPPYVLEYEHIAWKNKRDEFQPNLVTGLGYIDETKSDCIPAIADKFMRIQGVQTVVVYAIVEHTVRTSIRSKSSSIDCQTLCDELFGKGAGSGKNGIVGARVELNLFKPESMSGDDREILWKLIKNQIEHRFEKATAK